MSKIFIVDDNSDDYERISLILFKETYYPKTKGEFNELRCTFLKIFSNTIKKEAKELAKTKIIKIINDFVDEDTICIIDFQLDDDPKYNGLFFYENFIKGNCKKTIFVSGTIDVDDITKIEEFCKKDKNCCFIRKTSNYNRNKKVKDTYDTGLYKLVSRVE
jgi:hypothetical protein